MTTQRPGLTPTRRIRPLFAAVAAAALLAAPLAAHSQAVVMAGDYQNFDVLNNTGGPTHGFEMEVWGVSSSQLTRIFPSNWFPEVIRYGVGTATDFPGGVYVRWIAPYDPATGQFATSTPVPPSLKTVPGDSCWTLGMPQTYATAGCEHFGISTTYNVNPTKILYRWLKADPANPGKVIAAGADIPIQAPVWVAQAPAAPDLAPVVAAEVRAQEAEQPQLYGDAQWVRVFKTEHPEKVVLEDLVGDNPAVVAQDAAALETNWTLLQADPVFGAGNKRQRGKLANQGNLGKGNHVVVRRYEYYRYAGAYDPITHEALCADGTCSAPSPGELGDAIGAQNAAANIDVNALTVSVTGSGSVSSSDKVFACGNKCYGVYAPGATVALTAKAGSGAAFTGWTGACAGNASTCTVTLNAEKSVGATFAAVVPSFKVSVSSSKTGTVTATPSVADGTLNCGSTCTVKFPQNTLVTLTATPAAGKTFLGWSGACTGTAPVCSINVVKDVSVQPSFSK
ncbi:MAG: hypothetical protein U1F10_11795 [Burkholderiales bacterium]